MHRALLDLLVDPVTRAPLQLAATAATGDEDVREGLLTSPSGTSYPITRGIPRFVLTEDAGQRQTGTSFGFKWQQRDTYDSPEARGIAQRWLVDRYGFASPAAMRDYFGGRRRVLDAGCGSAFSSLLWLDPQWRKDGGAEWVGADISQAIDVAQDRLHDIPGTSFVQADILQLPFREGSFDTIFSEGVLHHTPSTEAALKALAPLLQPAGEILFYVYRKKGPLREFADDYIRDVVSPLPPADAWAQLRPLTRLGQALAELNAEVEVPEDIPYLGITAGRYDVQRLIYWHFAKLYWNAALSFEENNHVNFDWYHPRYAHRQTAEEVERWCGEAGLRITHFDVQESGLTVRATRG